MIGTGPAEPPRVGTGAQPQGTVSICCVPRGAPVSSPVPVGSPPHRPRAHSNDTNQPTAPATQPLLPPPLHAHSRYSDLSCSSLSLPTHRAALGHRAASATPPPAILALHMHPLLLTPPPLRYLLTPPPPPPPPASSFAARLLLRRPPPPSPPWRVLYAWTAHYTRHDAPEAPEGSRHHLLSPLPLRPASPPTLASHSCVSAQRIVAEHAAQKAAREAHTSAG